MEREFEEREAQRKAEHERIAKLEAEHRAANPPDLGPAYRGPRHGGGR